VRMHIDEGAMTRKDDETEPVERGLVRVSVWERTQ
jgi:hypothetical protein